MGFSRYAIQGVLREEYTVFMVRQRARIRPMWGEKIAPLKKNTNFEERFKGCKLQYSFNKQPNRRKAGVEQERLLKCYVKKYGEVPPNNNNFPEKHIDRENLRDSENIQAIAL